MGAWINTFASEEHGRPVYLVSSAGLAGSTNISGYANGILSYSRIVAWHDICPDRQDELHFLQPVTHISILVNVKMP